jgi:sterol desaturase/sphingolipid hydroxylase (fatty acid hydroxylase superfamily)
MILGGRVHAVTFGLWLVVRVVKTTEAHSGYQFPWSPISLFPFQSASEFHNYHHAKFTGNYGSFFPFWDRLCKTVHPSYDQFMEQRKLKKN